MISQRHRFHGYGSLKTVYRNGQTVRGPLFAVKYLLNPRRKNYRLAIVVSRKVSKSAVKRNRIRRRLYELVRLLEDGVIEPYDIVITVFHESVAEEAAATLASQVKKQFRQAGITRPKKPAPGDRDIVKGKS